MSFPIPHVYKTPLVRTYDSNGLASLVLQLVGLFVCLVLPLIIAFTTGDMWVKEFSVTGLPKVMYTNKAVVAVFANDTRIPPLVWTSLRSGERLLGDLYTPAFSEFYSEDLNLDDNADRLWFDIAFTLPPGFYPTRVESVFLLRWDFEDIMRISMESALSCSASFPSPVRDIQVQGDLDFDQRQPLIKNSYTRYDRAYSRSLFDDGLVHAPQDLEVSRVREIYGDRNETTPFRVNSVSSSPHLEGSDELEFSIRARIPPATIRYRPAVLSVLKFGLIQFFVFAYLLTQLWGCIAGGVVSLGLVNTVTRCPELDHLQRHLWKARVSY
eukprot:Hpha_TRINITY_DN34548_c0_g1::TRINITY_DN34548_c0_g1_i1::g.96274::m.96274/K19362/TMEM231; transmembrane protein 231